MDWFTDRARQIVEDEIANGEFPKNADRDRKARRIQAYVEWLKKREGSPKREWDSRRHE